MKNQINLNNVINLRGQREQAFKYATSKFKGGAKSCFTRGCEIFVPLFYSLKNIDLQNEIRYQCAFSGETEINEYPTYIF